MIRLKPILITGLFSFTLAATALSHAEAPLTATVALKQAETVTSTKETTTTQPIIAYFKKDAGTLSEHENNGFSAIPVADGYYRTLLGRDKNGRFLVQDFYQEGQKKQTDPFWIADEDGLNSFEIHYVDGEVRNYFKNGKLSTINVVKDGEFKGTTVSNYLTMNDIKILCVDFEEAVKTAKKGDFVYFDPPYDSDTTTFNSYTEDGFNKDSQRRLAEVFKDLDNRGVYVMLSNHNTMLINELYKDYNINVKEAKRNINANGKKRGKVEEVIITNFENKRGF